MDKKACTKCGQIKELGEFHKDKKRPDGLFPQCKACVRLNRSNWYAKNKERSSAEHAAYYLKNKETVMARVSAYYWENKDQINEATRQRRQEDTVYADQLRTREREYSATIEGATKRRSYKCRKPESTVNLYPPEESTVKKLLEAKHCFYCGCSLNTEPYHAQQHTIDHKISVARGGTNECSNLVAACRSCNMLKHAKTAEEYMDSPQLRKKLLARY